MAVYMALLSEVQNISVILNKRSPYMKQKRKMKTMLVTILEIGLDLGTNILHSNLSILSLSAYQIISQKGQVGN